MLGSREIAELYFFRVWGRLNKRLENADVHHSRGLSNRPQWERDCFVQYWGTWKHFVNH